MKIQHLFAIGLLLTTGFGALAQPQYVNYQGTLNDAEGNPLVTEDYTMEFNLFAELQEGTPIWGPFLFDGDNAEGHGAFVRVTQGRFNVILGPTDTNGVPIQAAFTNEQCYVEIRVNGDPLLPRQQVLSVPYALNAQALGGIAPVQYLNPPGMIVPFAGPPSKVPDGWLLCDGSPVTIADYPALYAAIGSAWGSELNGFRLPDLRGVFLRGVNLGRTGTYADPDLDQRRSVYGGSARTQVGSFQDDEFQRHDHTPDNDYKHLLKVDGKRTNTYSDNSATEPNIHYSKEIATQGGDETRPKNAAVNFIIKY